MTGDIWLVRTHGGPGFRGWIHRQIGDMISLVRPGRQLPWNDTKLELDGGFLLDTGKRVRLTPADAVASDPYASVFVVRHDWSDMERDLLNQVGLTYVGKRYSYWTVLGHVVARKVAAAIARMNGDTVICAECTGAVVKRATGYRFLKRHSKQRLDPEYLRPRDIGWTVATDDYQVRAPWTRVLQTTHGKAV